MNLAVRFRILEFLSHHASFLFITSMNFGAEYDFKSGLLVCMSQVYILVPVDQVKN